MIRQIRADGSTEKKIIAEIRARSGAADERISRAAAAIMADVRQNGWEAVERYSLQFDHAAPRELSREELEESCRLCDPKLLAAMEHAAANIRDYNEHLLAARTGVWSSPDGGTVGRVVRGLTRVGIYVPGGTAAYPSSVLMNAVPAKVAGVEELIMVTPPTENLNRAVLAAAKIAGVDRVIGVGGAQAVAALTYGAGCVPRVDKIVGPGNAYVAAAKRLAYGTVDIDMVAGPSEVVVIAVGRPGAGVNPRWIAADLLSQAEHDAMACAVLLTDSEDLAQQVEEQMELQLKELSRREIAAASLENFGAVIVCRDFAHCAAVADEIAPEHLEIIGAGISADEVGNYIKNAGAVFLGENTPEALGDYLAGPDHILPTSGTARFFSPLSAESFLKTTSVLQFDRGTLGSLAEEITTFARAEHLDAHANSVRVRFEE